MKGVSQLWIKIVSENDVWKLDNTGNAVHEKVYYIALCVYDTRGWSVQVESGLHSVCKIIGILNLHYICVIYEKKKTLGICN